MKLSFPKNFKFPKPDRRLRRRLIVLLLCGILFVGLSIFRSRLVSALPDVAGAKRFAPEGGYAQIGCYFADHVTAEPERYREFTYRVESALTANAIEADAENGGRLFLDCYSVDGSVTLLHDKKSVEAKAIGTGGEFFFLHPVELRSGMYYMADALMKDQILVDETIAWQLFGGTDIAGQTVSIGGSSFIISGVVKTGSGRMREAAGADGALVYLPASALKEYGTLRYGADRMSSYELVMPDPVAGFAEKLIRETLGFDADSMEIVDQTKRFRSFPLLSVLRDYGTRSMTGSAISYPYWENMARGTEDVLAPLVVLQALCILVPAVLVIWEVVYRYRRKEWTAQGIVTAIGDRIYELRAKTYAQQRNKKRA